MVYRVYVERRDGFKNEAKSLLSDLNVNLEANLKGVRYLNRYDVEGIDTAVFEVAKKTIFSEPQSDEIMDELKTNADDKVLFVEYLPGQFDQRADSCAQCVQLLTRGDRPIVKTAKVYVFEGGISDEMFEKIKKYIINPVESRETDDKRFDTLDEKYAVPADVATVEGFITADDAKLGEIMKAFGFAMDMDDLRFCQSYFRDEEKRDPTVTELRLIDTYWSDHCRHTTFLTEIGEVTLDSPHVKAAYERYLKTREVVYVDRVKPITLMDIATVGAKYLKKMGILQHLDESEEINACSVKIKAEINGEEQDWLLMFKNETHNHPTEIEPFGGAATCLGGAIRDPLSGRAYVYQAMRVTGAADPRLPVSETLEGKLPQSKLTQGAAAGYSSYGNQIGLATGGVYEMYHPGYVAKRLEIGAVVGAAPEANVIRLEPTPGDKIVLLGGRTGRDGCGGATGSSKSHTLESITTCGAEVQKGNPPEERKIQRLFRNPEVTRMIKRCNDFGAGGVSVAVGELADGLKIDLDRVPKKYEGLDGTELAVSESQERMAVVVRAEDAERFVAEAAKENLEATIIADVTEEKRLTMSWRGVTTVNLSREFLNSNGAKKHTDVAVGKSGKLYRGIEEAITASDIKAGFTALLGDLNVCCQKGLSERFDSSIGASTVVMPFGGKHQLTPPQYMAAKLPLTSGDTTTASYMAYGFDPYLSSSDPYAGSLYAVIESLARLVAGGIDYKTAYMSFQEYFERTKGDPSRWGKPFAALLGALTAQLEFGVGSIGGKDSMSGSFEDLDVPPTLVSFAIAASRADKAVTPEFKQAGSKVWYIEPKYTADGMPKFASFRKTFENIHALTEGGIAKSVWALGHGGIGEAIFKMAVGNGIGFKSVKNLTNNELFTIHPGAFVIETAADVVLSCEGAKLIGYTTDECAIEIGGEKLCMCSLKETWLSPLECVFPLNPKAVQAKEMVEIPECTNRSAAVYTGKKFAAPKVVIPVFPGTNCEYDTKRAYERAGANAEIYVLRNLNAKTLEESLAELTALISESQIFMIPGGFSGGDEPDGSGKFITAVLRNERVKAALTELLENRDGLMLGICNGFQALVKSGLLPYGKILDVMPEGAPTLTYNTISRHQSMMVRTKITSVKSPWMAGVEAGDVHLIPISHGEGRFTAPKEVLDELIANGQIATQYVDLAGNPTLDIRYNPNGSDYAIEGILSPDGRILGKMGHSERIGTNVARNVEGNSDQKLFESGVKYFK